MKIYGKPMRLKGTLYMDMKHEASQFDLLFKIPFQRCKIQVCTCLLTVGDMISILSIAGFCGGDRGECYDQLSR